MTKPMRIAQEAARPVALAATKRFVLVILPSYSPFDVTSAIAALEAANRHQRRALYTWTVVSVDGAPVRAPNGLSLAVDGALPKVDRSDSVLVCGGEGFEADCTLPLLAWLRSADRKGATLGGIAGGVHALAQAGLLSRRQVSTHWSLRKVMMETHPEVDVLRSIYVCDTRRVTCAGGVSTLDLLLHLIAQDHGSETATAVADRLVCSTPRTSSHDQTISEHCRTGVRHEKLTAALQLMQSELENPWTPGEIAEQVGLSTRQLERLFSKYLSATPKVFYTKLRLENARMLLQQTNMKIIEIGLANGFSSQSHFSRVYRKHFGISPHAERGVAGG
ncbi:MAG: GlxA family transcriptional regulator [Rhodobacteraceae bacterium]|jgi:transcriptional regulator GlxA family with amidase domain|nr:GlxA family transcriptional regulator [Paracoccaceae bacterium]